MAGISGINSSYTSYGNFASGKKINSAADGAAELSIIQNQNKDIGGLDQGAENLADTKNAINVQEGDLASVSEALQRMRDLALQSMNGTYSDPEKEYIQKEVEQLKESIAATASRDNFNGKKMLDGSESGITTVSDAKGTSREVSTSNSTLEALGIQDFDVTKDFDLKTLDDAMDKVISQRATLGAQSNSLDYAMNYNKLSSYNLNSSVSKLEDLDFAKAVPEQKKKETLQQYQTMMQRNKMNQELDKMKRFFS